MYRLLCLKFRKFKFRHVLIVLSILLCIAFILYHAQISDEFDEKKTEDYQRIITKRLKYVSKISKKKKIPIVGKIYFDHSNIGIRSKAVIEAMKHSWKAYKSFAWGKDEVYPLTNGSSTWMGAALTMIDSLDLLYIMGLEAEFKECIEWITENLHFDLNKNHVNVFETIIRVLGGLLSAFNLSKEPVLLEKALDLGYRLLPAFNTPTGLPMSDINLKTRIPSSPEWTSSATTSEAYTVILELYELSRASMDNVFRIAAEKVVKALHEAKKLDGLVPIQIDPSSGEFRSNIITLGARGDSYYEYLLKYWIQSGKKDHKMYSDYVESIQGIKDKLLQRSVPNKLAYIAESVPHLSHKMDHLVCFLPGTLALGTMHGMSSDHLNLAKDLVKTCYKMYSTMESGLSPEIVHFNFEIPTVLSPSTTRDIIVKEADKFNLQRPETIESLFYLYRMTGNKMYQDWGWKIFESFNKYSRVPWGGYVSVDNVDDVLSLRKRSKCESFWFSETLKYFYLLFHEDQTNLFPLNKFVFNTEGHPLPIIHSSTTNKTETNSRNNTKGHHET